MTAIPKRRWFRFSIRDLLWLTALLAIGFGWWIEHKRSDKYREFFQILKRTDVDNRNSNFWKSFDAMIADPLRNPEN